MRCFVRFMNNTYSPVISILIDGTRIFSDIIKDTASPYTALSVGTRELTVLQNNDKTYLTANISLSDNTLFTVILKDNEIIVLTETPSIHPRKNPS